MFQEILAFFKGSQDLRWSQEEREACLKLMLLIMYRDGTISQDEDKLFAENLSSFEWEGEFHRDFFLNNAIAEVRNLNSEPGREFFIRECLDAVKSEDIRKEIVSLCSRLMNVDGQRHEGEVKIVDRLRKELSEDE